MATEVKVPVLGESITEATLGEWLKQPGEAVAADEPIATLETDKVSVEVPAPVAGTMGAACGRGRRHSSGRRDDRDDRRGRCGCCCAAPAAPTAAAPGRRARGLGDARRLRQPARHLGRRARRRRARGAVAVGAPRDPGARGRSGLDQGHRQGRADHQGGRRERGQDAGRSGCSIRTGRAACGACTRRRQADARKNAYG